MPLIIPDDILEQANLTEQQARVEIACRLFQSRTLSLGLAARLAGLGRVDFEEALISRGIAPYYMDQEDWEAERDAVERIGW